MKSLEVIASNIYSIEYRTAREVEINLGRFSQSPSYGGESEGCVITSDDLKPILQMASKPRSWEEKMLLDILEARQDEPFCVIGTHKESTPETFFHELAHCFMYLIPSYKNYAEASARELDQPSWRNLYQFLRERGYLAKEMDTEDIIDEVQAFAIANFEQIKKNGFATAAIQRLNNRLNKKFTQCIGKIEWSCGEKELSIRKWIKENALKYIS